MKKIFKKKSQLGIQACFKSQLSSSCPHHHFPAMFTFSLPPDLSNMLTLTLPLHFKALSINFPPKKMRI